MGCTLERSRRVNFTPPSNLPERSEDEFHPELHCTAAARANQRIAGPDVRCLTAAAERRASRRVGAAAKARRSAERIGDGGVVKHVKKLDSELGAVTFLVLELLEHGEIHALEALVAEDVPAHRAERSGQGRSHHRFALHEAATGVERVGVGGHRLTLSPHRGGIGGGKEGLDARNAAGFTTTLRAWAS